MEITEQDSGKTFVLARSSPTPLRLSHRYSWSDPTLEGVSVQLTPVSYFRDPGFDEWTISTARGGDTVIRSSGTPNCGYAGTCPDRGLSFFVRIVVQ